MSSFTATAQLGARQESGEMLSPAQVENTPTTIPPFIKSRALTLDYFDRPTLPPLVGPFALPVLPAFPGRATAASTGATHTTSRIWCAANRTATRARRPRLPPHCPPLAGHPRVCSKCITTDNSIDAFEWILTFVDLTRFSLFPIEAGLGPRPARYDQPRRSFQPRLLLRRTTARLVQPVIRVGRTLIWATCHSARPRRRPSVATSFPLPTLWVSSWSLRLCRLGLSDWTRVEPAMVLVLRR